MYSGIFIAQFTATFSAKMCHVFVERTTVLSIRQPTSTSDPPAEAPKTTTHYRHTVNACQICQRTCQACQTPLAPKRPAPASNAVRPAPSRSSSHVPFLPHLHPEVLRWNAFAVSTTPTSV